MSTFKNVPVTHSVDYHGQKLTLQTGLLAKQATGTVLATIGETTVMAAAVVGRETDMPYFPLQVIYEERMYASGKIKGSRFIKREGRPSDNAVLTGRMVDRSLRSLFDQNIRNDIQVVITVLSVDEVNPPDILSVIAASAALKMCGINEFTGPVSSVRVGLIQEDQKETLITEILKKIPALNDFTEIEADIIKLSQSLDISNPEEKEQFAKVFYALGEKNSEWANKLKVTYQNTDKSKSSDEKGEVKYVINPSYDQQKVSEIDLVISGNGEGVVMLEAGANIVSEDSVSSALDIAGKELTTLTAFQNEFLTMVEQAGLMKKSEVKIIGNNEKALNYWKSFETELETILYQDVDKKLKEENLDHFKEDHYSVIEKLLELQKISQFKELPELKKTALHLISDYDDEDNKRIAKIIEQVFITVENFAELETLTRELKDTYDIITKKIVKRNILENERRLDGRSLTETREILCQTGILPRTHGSSLFSRGETQVLNVLTLGTKSDAQLLDDMEDFEERSKRYIHHYNFPSYSVGETGRYFGPGRREIGHGALAEKALVPVLPSEEDFPYTMRLVSECLGSNGSTSMASTCGSCLSLMQGGVPIKDMVAGVAMGLMLDSKTGNFKVITDIQGIEDHYGDMDFKVTGTGTGITAIQLDNKVAGLTTEILKQAIVRSREARLHILSIMKEAISEPSKELSVHAPRVLSLTIAVDKIGDVIGPGGKIIKEIIASTGCEVDIEEDGRVYIYGKDSEKAKEAKQMIETLVKEYQPGDVVEAKVFRIEAYGAFVKIDGSDKEGLIHISNMADKRVEKVEDIVKMGQTIKAKVLEINEKGQIGLTLK